MAVVLKASPRLRILLTIGCSSALLLGLAGAFSLRRVSAAEDAVTKQEAARKAYGDEVKKYYHYINAGAAEAVYSSSKLSLPGNATVQGGDFIEPSAFPTAEYCGHCHKQAYAEWRQALHSNSFRTPFYRKSVNLLAHEKGIAFARHCDSCHNPIAVVSGSLDAHATGDRSFDHDGVTCMTCHSIQRVDSKLGNGSYTMAVPSVIVDEHGNRIPGMVSDAEILSHLDRHSKAVMQTIYQSPEFCSACHKANLPVMLNDYKWIRAFSTYDEWQLSKYSNQNPLVFYTADYTTCQGCHMKREPTTLPEPGAKKGMFASHRWLAGNTAVPFYYGFEDQLQKTIDFLRTGNYLNVDVFGIKTAGSDELAGPLGSVPFKVDPRQPLEVYVVVQNKAIGHSLLPEVRDLYEAWVAFTVTDAVGKKVYESGYLKPDGTLDPGAHSFVNKPVDSKGEFVDNHRVWTIHSVAYDNTVQSGRSALIRYRFHVPQTAAWPIKVTASIRYRHLRQTYLNNVLGTDHPAYPVVELSSRSRVIDAGENGITAPLPADNPDWMRWNNLGIGYLDELQYADAQYAFAQVTRLRPDYKDGYINVALNYIEWEKYAQARAPLEKALTLAPRDARAMYYLAIVERREGHPEQAIADLESVVAQYPRARDALRELGISYYQQHRAEDAVATFKRLQDVDPDDLAAHYNLAVLYRRLGMKAEAAKESAQYAMKWIDPAAPTYSLEYLRKHPEISIESVPWHVHSDESGERSGGAGAAIGTDESQKIH